MSTKTVLLVKVCKIIRTNDNIIHLKRNTAIPNMTLDPQCLVCLEKILNRPKKHQNTFNSNILHKYLFSIKLEIYKCVDKP